jgi:hypothetical protein
MVKFVDCETDTVEVQIPPTAEFINEIRRLCAWIDTQPNTNLNYSLGTLDSASGEWQRLQARKIPQTIQHMKTTISLSTLLERNTLQLETRLELSVLLSSAVMQLHATEWLSDSWGCQDIFFFVNQQVLRRAPDGTLYPDPILDKPFVRCSFGPSANPSTSHNGASHRSVSQLLEYDKCLFSLATVLIELWYGRIFEGLKDRDDRAWETARRLASCREMDDSGDDYIRAVERCLGRRRAVWDAQSAPRSLEHQDFKKEIYVTVVTVLEENYKVGYMYAESLQLI